jgi:hypothetical protein
VATVVCGVKVSVRGPDLFRGREHRSSLLHCQTRRNPRKFSLHRMVVFLVLKTSVEGRLPLGMRLGGDGSLLQRGAPLLGMGSGARGDQVQGDRALYSRLDCPVTESHPCL